MALRTRNSAVLFKVQSAEGTFEAPSPSADGVLVERPSIQINPQNTNTDEVSESLDAQAPIVGGMQAQVSFTVNLKGPGTPGEAPEWGDMMRACGFSETVTKTDITGTDISFVAAGPSIDASTTDLSAATVGTVIHVQGAANSENNGEFLVTSSSATSLGVSKVDGSAAGLVDESAGASITIRYGIAGAAATAGTTTSFTAGATFAGTAQVYRGMPVLLSTNPSTPVWAFISDYTASKVTTLTDLMGAALDNTTVASIPANVLYTPASDSIPWGSMEVYRDGVVYQFRDCIGTVSFTFNGAGAIQAQFQFSGLVEGKNDAAVPSGIAFDGTRPGTFRNSKMLVHRKKAAVASFTLDPSLDIQFPTDPNDPEGFQAPIHTGRSMTGQVDPLETKVATRDIFADFRQGNRRIIHARVLGANAANPGQRLGETIPSAIYTGYTPDDRNGLAVETVAFFAEGEDSGAFLDIY